MGTHDRPWCSQHNMHPSRCFDIHNPVNEKKAHTEEQHRLAILAEHLRRQSENIRKQEEKLNRTPEEICKLRKKHPKE